MGDILQHSLQEEKNAYNLFIYLFIYLFFRATSVAYGDSQARG